METTYFTINKRRQLYIKVGAWCSSKHPPRTPGYIWKESVQDGCYDVPKLRISSVAMNLAKTIGKHSSPIFVSAASGKKEEVLEMEMDQSINSEGSTSNTLSDDDEEASNNEMSNTTTPNLTHLLNFEEYPLFNHHRLNIQEESTRNRVVHELLKSCDGNSIFYHQIKRAYMH